MQNTMQAFTAASADASTSSATPPDFDFQMPCRYFKSSFARSLSLSGNVNGANGIALALAKKSPQNVKNEANRQGEENGENGEQQQELLHMQLESPCLTPPPALPARRHTTSSNINNNNLTHFIAAPVNQLPSLQQQQLQLQQQKQHQQRNLKIAASWSLQDAAPNNSNSNNNLPQQQSQQLLQQPAHEQTLNVEAVILQNQVDTLHWQLKQTETNCEMYRAVMEEVARFFERYQQQQQQLQLQQQQLQLQQQQQRQQQLHLNRHSLGGEQISRSKSLHHVQGIQNDVNGCLEDVATTINGSTKTNASNSSSNNNIATSCTASYLRARSSTNLMLSKAMHEDHSYESIAPAGSYNAFKDFTWRRSPKKLGGCKSRLSSPEAAEEKLNQEAFRLARTIRNLLHTSEQQPDLTQPRHSLSSLNHHQRLCNGQKANSSAQLLTLLVAAPQPLHNSTIIDSMPNLPAGNSNTSCSSSSGASCSSSSNSNTNPELLFLRANTMRDSRLSLRSSTDSSVHSTISSTASSSSKIETDEELNNLTTDNINSNNMANKASKPVGNNQNHNGSSTEDESGFSSISSFHDVGLPLSSTLIGDTSSSSSSRNSTLKSALNAVGVPPSGSSCSTLTLPSPTPLKTYRNANRYQRFSTLSNEDATAVLWV